MQPHSAAFKQLFKGESIEAITIPTTLAKRKLPRDKEVASYPARAPSLTFRSYAFAGKCAAEPDGKKRHKSKKGLDLPGQTT